MGWFSIFPCFSNSKHRKLKKTVNPTTSSSSVDEGIEKTCDSVLIKFPTEESTNLGSLQNPISESRDNYEDRLINDSDDHPVTIDLDVEVNEYTSIEVVKISSDESKESKEKKTEEIGELGVLVQIENEKERENEEAKEKDNLENLVQTENEIDGENKLKTEEKKNEAQNRTCSDSSVSSYISYPPMHRYHNSVINEDEDHVIQEDSSESLFSLSVNPRTQSKSAPVEFDDKEVNSPLKTNAKSNAINSLLNPIENLTQWKTLIPKPIPTFNRHQQKENIDLQQQEETHIPLCEEPTYKVSDQKGKVKKESVVTTSLSSWLIEPDKTGEVSMGDSQFSVGNSCTYSDEVTSWKSFEDRPILGAWTIDEVRHVSARSSPRKSPRRDLDETPIIGSVGSYWNHTGQGTDSSSSFSSPLGKPRRNREKKASSCHSTPAKARF